MNIRLCSIASIGLIAFCGFALQAHGATPTTREVVEQTIRENEASRAKIKTIEFDFTTNQKTGGHFVYSGNNRANSYELRHQVNTNCIITDRFAAIWQRGSLAELFVREPGKPLGKDARERINSLAGFDPLWCGFGVMFGNLRDSFAELDPKQLRVEEGRNEQNEKIIKISYLLSDVIGEKPFVTYEFNADRGYLLTRTKGYNELGWLTGTSDVTVKQIGGVWVPVHAQCATYRFKAGTTHGDPRVIDERDFTNIHVNQPVDPARFEIASLGIPAGATVLQYDSDGKATERVMPATQPLVLPQK